VTTDVGLPGGQPGDCASACVLAYLGGHYRYLREGSRLGVHQFYPTDDNGMTGAEGVAVGQVLSGEVVDYLADRRVDPAFFRRMTEPRPEEILWVPPQDLDRYNVVTGPVQDQRTEYRNADGFYYLTLWQQSLYGENKLLLTCNETGGIGVMAYLQPPNLSAVEATRHDLRVLIDGVEEAPRDWDLIGTDDRWAIALFALSDGQVARLTRARSLGARLYPQGAGWFFGFDYTLEDDSLREMIEGCRLRGLETAPPDPAALAGAKPDAVPAPDPTTMTVLPDRAFAGVALGAAVPSGAFEDCEALCLADAACLAVTYTTGTGLCQRWSDLGPYSKALGSISALRP
jgi:hypothetical protein